MNDSGQDPPSHGCLEPTGCPAEPGDLATAELIGADIQLAIFFLVGVFGNSLIIAVFWDKVRKWWHSTDRHVYNHTILALAVADLAALLIFVPYELANINGFVTSLDACKAMQYLTSTIQMCVHLVLSIAIPVERYFAVCRPHSEFGSKQVLGILVGIGAFSLLSGVGFGVLSEVVADSETGRHLCTSSYSEYSTDLGIAYIAVGALGVLCIFVFYAMVLTRIWHTQQKMKDYMDKRSIAQFNAVKRVVFMLFGVTVVYLLCWMPYFLDKIEVIPRDYRYKFFFLFNNATNFLVYGVCNGLVRRAMIKKLKCQQLSRATDYSTNDHTQTDHTMVDKLPYDSRLGVPEDAERGDDRGEKALESDNLNY